MKKFFIYKFCLVFLFVVIFPQTINTQEQKSFISFLRLGNLKTKVIQLAKGGKAIRKIPGMVYIPAGKFIMGSNDYDDEKPSHKVYLSAYYIDKYEVTNKQFAQFLNEKGNQTEGGVTWLDIEDEDCRISKTSGGFSPKSGYSEHPVVEVSWYGARAYCKWKGMRLPTEAEWEKAARGGDGRKYPWGDSSPTCSLANYGGCGGGTKRVGSHLGGASPYGVHDMAGNVWEWVADWYDGNYYKSSPRSNPQGPGSGTYKVLRGGSWNDTPDFIRASSRFIGLNPNGTDSSSGFRCACRSSP